MSKCKSRNRLIMIFLMMSLLLINSRDLQAQTATPYYDLFSWQSEITGEEFFETIAANVELANGVGTITGNSFVLGSPLTYESDIQLDDSTILTKGFQLKTGVADGEGFVYNDGVGEAGTTDADWMNAISVEDSTTPNDDWSLMLLNNASMNALAFELRNNTFELGESITFYNNNVPQHTFILDHLVPDSSSNDFIGFTTDFAFDEIKFDEGSEGDNVGIADLRFATVVPEPISYVLFVVGAGILGLRRFSKGKKS